MFWFSEVGDDSRADACAGDWYGSGSAVPVGEPEDMKDSSVGGGARFSLYITDLSFERYVPVDVDKGGPVLAVPD